MTGFDELVERAREQLARGDAAGPTAVDAGGLHTQAYLASREHFESEFGNLLAGIEGNSRPFELRAEEATTPLRRTLARVLGALLRVGGLGKHLGVNQLRANQATMKALRMLHERLRDQDRALEKLAAALGERKQPREADPEPR